MVKSITDQVDVLDGRGEVGVLAVGGEHGRLHDVAGDLDVDARPVHRQQVHALQVPQPPDQLLWAEVGSVEVTVLACLLGLAHLSQDSAAVL